MFKLRIAALTAAGAILLTSLAFADQPVKKSDNVSKEKVILKSYLSSDNSMKLIEAFIDEMEKQIKEGKLDSNKQKKASESLKATSDKMTDNIKLMKDQLEKQEILKKKIDELIEKLIKFTPVNKK